METVKLSIVMPCLNEAETLAQCIEKAKTGIASAGVPGEIVIADNGSTDGSIEIAIAAGARVIHATEKGYGNALRAGIAGARGEWIIMGDADDSYDFSRITQFAEKLAAGSDLVMGCRLPSGGGSILPGAMPWKNRWIGNPALSSIGRLFFKVPIHDFHCGLRAFRKGAYEALDLKTTGMEFASEMVIKAVLRRLRVEEVPITLSPDGRSRPPHLRPWRDGWRHLRFMLIYSPRWLFLYPGLLLALLGAGLLIFLWSLPQRELGEATDIGMLLVAAMALIIGVQSVAFACFTKVFAIAEGLLPHDPRFSRVFKYLKLEAGLAIGGVALVGSLFVLAQVLWSWRWMQMDGEPLEFNQLRVLTSAATGVVVGVQVITASLFMSVLGLKTTQRQPPEAG